MSTSKIEISDRELMRFYDGELDDERAEEVERWLDGEVDGDRHEAALDKLGEAPFYVINGDVVWLDGVIPALRRLATSWDPERMDGLLLLHPTITAHGYDGAGDFIMASDGHLRRRLEREVAAFLFAGVQILHPRLFKGAPDGAFSLNLLYDRAIEAERLCGLRHDGEWFHVGTPQALELADELLREEIGDRPASFRRNLAEVKER